MRLTHSVCNFAAAPVWHWPQQHRAIGAAMLCALLGAGCSAPSSPDARLSEAIAQIEQGEYRTASIGLKLLLREDPGDTAVRLALARAALGTGDMLAAEKEIRKADVLGAGPDQTQALLARVLFTRNAYRDLLQEINPSLLREPSIAGEVRAYRARAALALGSVEQAEQEFDQLLRLELPTEVHRLSLIGKAEVAQARGNIAGAEQMAREALARAPASAQSHLVLARALLVQKKYQQAHDVLITGQDQQPDPVDGFMILAGLIEAHLGLGELGQARATADLLRESRRQHPMVGYWQGRVAYHEGDMDSAIEQLRNSLSQFPNYAPAQTLLGIAHLQRGDLDQAQMLLSTALANNPQDQTAKSALAQVRARLAKADSNRGAGTDMLADQIDLLNTMAQLSSRTDNTEARIAQLNQRVVQHPKDVDSWVALAAAHAAAGQRERAVQIINTLDQAQIDPARKQVLLLLARHQPKQPQNSIGQIRKLVAAWPDNAPVQAMMAQLLTDAGVHDEAQLAYERSLGVRPDHLPSILGLGRLSERTGDFAAAKTHLSRYLATHPTDQRVLLSLSRIGEREGNEAASAEYLQRAHAAHPQALLPNLALASRALQAGDLEQARVYAQTASKAVPGSDRAFALLGEAYTRLGQPDRAIEAYQAGYQAYPSRMLAVKTMQAMLASGDAKALEPVRDWLRREPNDIATRTLLATQLVNQGETDAAMREYEQGLKTQPDYAPALNNLAWLYHQRPEPASKQRAIELAERAHWLAPSRPDITDTYGWILVQAGRLDEGRALFEQAISEHPPQSMPDIAYHLAAVMQMKGEREAARALLEAVLSGAGEFYSRAEAQALHEQL